MRAVIGLVFAVMCLGLASCSQDPPFVDRSLQRFDDERTVEEYLRKSELWLDTYDEANRKGTWSAHDCDGDGKKDCWLEEIVVMAAKREAPKPSITNIQEVGVDEGDIVKRVGDYIVVLRRGRLFSFALPSSAGEIGAVDYIDIDVGDDPLDAWYDEILSHEDIVLVLGYSYEIDASIIHRFRVTNDGSLSRDGSWFIKSEDYYDTDNYSTRLVDGNLVLYAPRDLFYGGLDLVSGRLEGTKQLATGDLFVSDEIYQPLQQSLEPVAHTIAVCPLDSDELRCTARGIVGPWSRLTYVSRDAAYLWLNSNGWAYDYFVMDDTQVKRIVRDWIQPEDYDATTAVLYRIPLDGGPPGFIEVSGWPIDQFSFSERDDSLFVFSGNADEDESLTVKLLEVPLAAFESAETALSDDHYQVLSTTTGELNSNRFVGDWFMYDEIFWDEDYEAARSELVAVKVGAGQSPIRLPMEHFANRIDAIGDTAVIIGGDTGTRLGISTIRTRTPLTPQTAWIDDAFEAASRSHSFNYSIGTDSAIFGFPVIFYIDEKNHPGYYPEEETNVHMKFFALDRSTGVPSDIGELVNDSQAEDNCMVSCSDWYGDARPFFIDDKVYALIRYQLIEGYVSGQRVQESARVDGLSLLPIDPPTESE